MIILESGIGGVGAFVDMVDGSIAFDI